MKEQRWTECGGMIGPRPTSRSGQGSVRRLRPASSDSYWSARCLSGDVSGTPPFLRFSTSIKYSCQIYCVGTIDPLVLVTAAFWHALQHMSSRSGLNVEGFACFCTADICDSVEKVTDFTSETRRIYIYPPGQIDLIWQFNPLRDVLSVIKEKTSASRIPCVSKEWRHRLIFRSDARSCWMCIQHSLSLTTRGQIVTGVF